jgi:hypothetical protein
MDELTLPPELPENFTIPPGMNFSNGTDGNDLLGNIFQDAINNERPTSTGAEDESSSSGSNSAGSSIGVNVSRVVVEPVFEDQPMFVYQKVRWALLC